MKLNVVDAIDRPIRDLVLNINRIGLQTVFSCCGFTYPDEEEPKSHGKDAFIIFKDPSDGQTFVNFLYLTRYALTCSWTTHRYSPDHWAIRFEPGNNQKEFWSKPSLHDYELYSIAIYRLNKIVDQMDSYKDEFQIVDGNTWYHEQGIHWQIQPKDSVTIKV